MCCHNKAANDQLLRAATFWIIRIVSTEECSSLTQNLMQIRRSTCSVILTTTATQYTCSLSDTCRPSRTPALVQWSRHCSHLHIPAHSPWLPGHIDAAQTVPVILAMAARSPDRPCVLCSTQQPSTPFHTEALIRKVSVKQELETEKPFWLRKLADIVPALKTEQLKKDGVVEAAWSCPASQRGRVPVGPEDSISEAHSHLGLSLRCLSCVQRDACCPWVSSCYRMDPWGRTRYCYWKDPPFPRVPLY